MEHGVLQFAEPVRDTSRKIIHVDMDAFYASVEERENPELKGKPLVIARHPKDNGGRGVVTTANYEARKYGIHSAMSAQKAYELCPQAIFVPGRHELYQEISTQIREVFKHYTDIIEPLALDEAYLDVTENKKGISSATVIAKMIQKEIWEELHLTCSAGVSYNKFIAKLASDYKKPAGITVIPPEKALVFLKELPIGKFYGVGKKTAEKMHDWGVFTGQDLVEKSEMDLIQRFGKMGYSLYRKVRGIDNNPVESTRVRKSVGREHTYGQPLTTEEEILAELRFLAGKVHTSLVKVQKHGKVVVLKVRTSDYETMTKRISLPSYVKDSEEIYFHALNLWEDVGLIGKEIRLLGITVTNLDPLTFENIVLPLWEKEK
ncbi:DNA polymerase IV [Carnobacterium divergens]|uniref:DNA polymerase IV n=1 Tax=Carnobacterium divergens TaxID=2748 RepID=A0AAW8R9F8_CARDV|nr:DNA polymerase IV [Carnobacterium divergens]AOA00290.1 DNA polymerase IV [Carnobacterium divergens]MDT1958079.1 DNA polymerase IV [Carnobacterium divergens]MDT1974082.1 DNA polymerase IV [Carnobacterium divergens]MDT2011308.1 DNA polymerase IV [Carnobacterium divergens]TFJ38930.1 DNA polymerase IV [Carnobacterium divergens]